jgi:hypothetical protein
MGVKQEDVLVEGLPVEEDQAVQTAPPSSISLAPVAEKNSQESGEDDPAKDLLL